MDSSALKEIYDTAIRVVQSNDWASLDYVSSEQLAMWLVRVCEGFTQRKVLTERLYGQQDISVILTQNRVSVVLNDTSQSSYAKFGYQVTFDVVFDDMFYLLQMLDLAILKAQLN